MENGRERELSYDRESLAAALAGATSWADLIRRLGYTPSGGRRRVLQETVAAYGLDTSHFRHRSPWRKYPDEAIAKAAASSSSIREVVAKLGAAPATGTLSHIRRRIAAAGIDISHFPGLNTVQHDLPFTSSELAAAAGVLAKPRASATQVFGVRPAGSPRTNRARLHRALQEFGVPYRCASCRNPGEWLGEPITLQIDHVDGNWLDNRLENLRYLCPNCHALTETWCRKRTPRQEQD
jgi:hypothetical protein